jgi:4-diphosphocytidyl-2-C-methyl-D-erythritol kinase
MARIGLYDHLSLELTEPGQPSLPISDQGGLSQVSEGDFRDSLVFENQLGPPFEDGLATNQGFNGPGNLVLRTLRVFRAKTGFPASSVRIKLIKRIPLGAGLGGGSSDAAAVLRLLNQKNLMPMTELKLMARDLGGDVPFFLEDETFCWAGGIGELLWPYRGQRLASYILLVNPGFELSTAKVFERLGLTFCLSSSISHIQDRSQEVYLTSGQPNLGENDLEKAATGLAPSLEKLRKKVSEIIPAPLNFGLSGSGPTYWALYDRLEKAQAALDNLADSNYWVRLVPLYNDG